MIETVQETGEPTMEQRHIEIHDEMARLAAKVIKISQTTDSPIAMTVSRQWESLGVSLPTREALAQIGLSLVSEGYRLVLEERSFLKMPIVRGGTP